MIREALHVQRGESHVPVERTMDMHSESPVRELRRSTSEGASIGAGATFVHAAPWAGAGAGGRAGGGGGGAAWAHGAPTPLGSPVRLGAEVGARPGGVQYAKYETPEVVSLGAGEFWASEVWPATNSFEVETCCGSLAQRGPRAAQDYVSAGHTF